MTNSFIQTEPFIDNMMHIWKLQKDYSSLCKEAISIYGPNPLTDLEFYSSKIYSELKIIEQLIDANKDIIQDLTNSN